MSFEEKLKELGKPFQPQDVEWRVQQSGVNNGMPWAMVIPYVTNRAIQKRLDDVFGPANWQNEYREAPPTNGTNNWLCGLTVRFEGDFVTKWDGAPETSIEPIKGGLSDSMKRAAVQYGIGRYLYQLEPIFAICRVIERRRDVQANENYAVHTDKKSNAKTYFAWETPPLPEWALPGIDFLEFITPVKEAQTLEQLKERFTDAYRKAEATGDSENTETLIQVKDQRKEEIIKKLTEEKEKNKVAINEWLYSQIDAIGKVPNISAVTSLSSTINASLVDQCKAVQIDSTEFENCLRQSVADRINHLEMNQG